MLVLTLINGKFDVKSQNIMESMLILWLILYIVFLIQVPDIIDNAYVIVEFENGSRGMLDLCMFAEGSKNEQEISVVGEIGKVWYKYHKSRNQKKFCNLITFHI